MIACSRCGQESPQGSLHCVNCGSRLSGEEDGPAKTVIGMPALKPLGSPAGERKPGSLLAGLPALRTKTSSPLVSGEFSLKAPEGAETPAKTVVGLPLFEGAKKASDLPPVDPEAATLAMQGLTDDQLGLPPLEEPAATLAMQGLTDEQLGQLPPDEPAPTLAMAGLTDAQLEPAAPRVEKLGVERPAEKPGEKTAQIPATRPRKDDPAHHPQRKEKTQAMKPGERKGSGLKWAIIALVVAGAAYAAWYFTR